MRERLCQIQRCRQSKLAEIHGHGKAETLPQLMVLRPLQFAEHTVDNSKAPINASKSRSSPEPVILGDEDESYSRWFDFSSFPDNYGYDELERTNVDQIPSLQSPRTNATDPLDPTLSAASFPVSTTNDASVQYPNTIDRTNLSAVAGLLEPDLLVASDASSLRTYSDKGELKTAYCSPGQLFNPPELENEVGGVQRAECIAIRTGSPLEPRTVDGFDGTQGEATASSGSQTLTLLSCSESYTLLKTQAGSPTHTRAIWASQASSEDTSSSVLKQLSNLTFSDETLITDCLDNSSDCSSSKSSSSRISGGSSISAHATPLMERIRSSTSEDKYIEELIRAETEVEAQDTRGETALHLSVQLGKKSATKALLCRGANVHAKNKMGQSVLAVALKAQRRVKEDESLYARISECIALSMRAGAVAAPVLHQGHYSTELKDPSRRKEQDPRYHR